MLDKNIERPILVDLHNFFMRIKMSLSSLYGITINNTLPLAPGMIKMLRVTFINVPSNRRVVVELHFKSGEVNRVG